jgi:hypothetical protein
MGRAFDQALSAVGSARADSTRLQVDLLPDTTTDEAGGFESSDARLRADVPPHHRA